ncbi:hypothetical protein OIDMADRAFT_138454, partial [Oidiodendron maius Zn]
NDVITGKGQGLNILLYGNPGLRKTLTAEAISEHLKSLLYLYYLNKDLVCNSLVSVFLYKLEYYKGIIFLTINCIL